MKPEIEEGIIRWVRERTKFVPSFHVGWFGGEPLLRFDVIERLGEEFKRLSEERGFKFSMSISTNGYLMDEEKVQKLADLGLRYMQVTLDGPPEVHDARRRLVNGKGTFNVIMENLLTFNKIAPQVELRIRVNFDKTNIDDIPKLFKILPEGLREQAKIYFYPVFARPRTWEEIGCQPLLNPPQEIAKLLKESIKAHLRVSLDLGPRTAHCMAESWNYFVIGPDGSLYKCLEKIGSQDRVGYITLEGKVYTNHMLTKWLSIDPFEDKECRNCKLLPLCMGGCGFCRIYNEEKIHLAEKGAEEAILNIIYLQFKKEVEKGNLIEHH